MNNEEKILALLEKHSTMLEKHNTMLEKQGAVLDQHSIMLEKQGAVLDQHSIMLEKQGAVLDQHSIMLEKQGAMLDKHNAMLDKHSAMFETLIKDVVETKERIVLMEHNDKRQFGALHDGYKLVYDKLKPIPPVVESLKEDVSIIKDVVTSHSQEINVLRVAR